MSLFGPRALRWSLVELCRRTSHEGWEHLQAARAAGRGVALIAPAGTDWVVAARALAAWAGPLHLAIPQRAADRKLARAAAAIGDDGPRLEADPEAIERALARAEMVLWVVEAGERPEPEVPDRALRLALVVETSARGRYRLVLGPAVEPAAGSRLGSGA